MNPEKEILCANPTSIAMIGYDFGHDDEFGLCLAAVRQLTIALDGGNAEDRACQFSIGVRVYELRKKEKQRF
jgi:hypothetical protein